MDEELELELYATDIFEDDPEADFDPFGVEDYDPSPYDGTYSEE